MTTKREIIKLALEEVMDDVMLVFDFGAKKHPDKGTVPNFLLSNGNKCGRRVRGSSCLRHAAEVFTGAERDHESNLPPELHLIASAAILYIRKKKGIVHPDDVEVK